MRSSTRRFWAYATAFGAVWGALEITVGTFLHTIRLPFAGAIMACAGAALLVAQRQLLPVRGLALATGVIAAACKAISPGGVIFGPMIGIFSEAAVLELALLVLPRSRLSISVGGALLALWPLTHKLLAQFVYYGGTVFELYLQALQKLSASIGVDDKKTALVGFAMLLLLALLGALSALWGRRIGLLSVDVLLASRLQQRSLSQAGFPVVADDNGVGMGVTAHERSQAWRTTLVVFIAVFAIATQWYTAVFIHVVGVLVLLSSLALLRPAVLRRMWMPRFWTLTALLALASGLLLGPKDIALWDAELPILSSVGLRAGVEMLLRAALVFALTAWAALTIDPQVFMRVSAQVGLGRLGQAMTTALSALPALRQVLVFHVEEADKTKARLFTVLRKNIGVLRQAVLFAVRWAETASVSPASRPVFVALVGARHVGKTATVLQLHQHLLAQGVRSGGMCQPADLDRGIYELLDLETMQRHRFATAQRSRMLTPLMALRTDQTPGFVFDPQGWGFADDAIANAFERKSIVFVDELGRLEARGNGHMKALRRVLQRSVHADARQPCALVFGVQRAFVVEIAAQLGGFDHVLLLPADVSEFEELTQALVELCGQHEQEASAEEIPCVTTSSQWPRLASDVKTGGMS